MTPQPSLQTLQSQFQHALLSDQALGNDFLSARGVAQFGVYRIAYRARLRAALRDNFEVLPLVMGDDAFDALANAYIDAHPSQHYSLRWFGHLLCEFMIGHGELVDHPALVDLAQLQWALRHAFDAASAELLTTADLAAVPAEQWAALRFTLHPSVQRLDLQWAVGPIWHALKSGPTEMGPPEPLDHALMVWRLGMNTRWKSLSNTEAEFVKGLQAHGTFGQVCESLVERVGEEEAAATAVAHLSELLTSGVICALPSQASRPK
jgi:hypothetical protein